MIEIEDSPSFDNGVTYAIEHLAQLLGVTGWQIREGSEDYATDVANTIDGVLELAGIRNDETGEIVRRPLPDFVAAAAGVELQPWQRALLEAIESRKNSRTNPAPTVIHMKNGDFRWSR